MDVQYVGVAVAVFGITVGCLLFFFKFGIKEKSYEEALAEQRQQSNALLGIRPKPKEKKVKKAKKSKEKQQPSSGTEQEKTEDSDDAVSETNSTALKPHVVEFKEPEIIAPEKDLPSAPVNKKRTKKEKVKPILINKELVEKNTLPPPTVETPSANHFELLHPKDEFELLHSHIKEVQKPTKTKDDVKQEKVNNKKEEPKPNKKSAAAEQKKSVEPEQVKNAKKVEQQEAVTKQQQNKKTTAEVVVVVKKNVKQVEAKQPVVVEEEVVAVKEEETVESSAVALSKSNGIVVNSGKEKKKKKSEFNALQQLAEDDKQGVNLTILQNLVRKAELSRSEVQLLIDLLLNKQHEAPTIIEDWSEGKSDPVQKLKKQLAEKERLLQEEQEALIGAQSKLREIRAEQNAEKSQFNQKIRQLEEALQNKQIEIQAINTRLHTQTQKLQQLQAQLNEEMLTSRKVREEQNALLAQRNQMECRLAQAQEADAVIAQLRTDVQELTSQNNQFNVDLHQLRAENDGYIAQLKQQLATYQQDLGKLQKDLEQSGEFARQQEQARLIAERHVDVARIQVSEVEGELASVKGLYQKSKEEVRRLEMVEVKAREDLVHLTQQKEDVERLVGKLKKELTEARAEMQMLQQQQTNGTLEQNKIHHVERLNLQNEITSLKSQLQQVETQHAQEVQTARSTIYNLEANLIEQKNKNDELRKKNWKVMEALNAAESKVNVNDVVLKARLEEQQVNRKFIQRLFPEVQALGDISQNQWLVEVEKLIQNHLKRKENVPVAKAEANPDVAKLQAQIASYKTIIDDTEGMLNKLQQHIEQQEANWSSQLKVKEGEIENLRENTLNKLQKAVTTLETELASEKESRRLLQQQLESLKSTQSVQNDSTVVIERLSEEVDRLRAQLQEKQNGNIALIQQENSLPKSQTLSSTNGPALIQGNGN